MQAQVFNHSGEFMRTYEGDICVNRYLDNGISMSVNGNMVIIINAIVIIENEDNEDNEEM